MSLTRDQLRAARVLLHLQQTQLAEIARIGVATIRRFEGGKDIGHLYLEALRRAVVDAGAILIDASAGMDAPAGTVGVALRPEGELPEATRARIAADEAQAAAGPPKQQKKKDDQPASPPSKAKPVNDKTGSVQQPALKEVSDEPSVPERQRNTKIKSGSHRAASARRGAPDGDQPPIETPTRQVDGSEPPVQTVRRGTRGKPAPDGASAKRGGRRGSGPATA